MLKTTTIFSSKFLEEEVIEFLQTDFGFHC